MGIQIPSYRARKQINNQQPQTLPRRVRGLKLYVELMRKLIWKIFYSLGWVFVIVSNFFPFGKIAWMDSGPHEWSVISFMLFTFYLPLFFPVITSGNFIIFYSVFIPVFKICGPKVRIFSLFITIIVWLDHRVFFVVEKQIGYYLWAASLTSFTFAVWLKRNSLNSHTEPRKLGPADRDVE